MDDLIKQQGYDPTHVLESRNIRTMLKQALITDYELTLLTPVVLKKYASLVESAELDRLLEDDALVSEYCETNDVLDMVQDFPAPITIEDFISILRKLPPRLYSVSCSPKKYPDQVQLMVGIVSFKKKRRAYEGVSSSFLSTRIEEGESIGVYLEENQKFRLPGPDVPIVMISAGTGLAPFRAFLQEREATGAKGKNWLFFGEQHSASDFFYQDELEGYLEKGLLTKMDTSFSRDQKKKSYIDRRMLEHSGEIYRWIEEGAIIYLCGNKNKLAVSVRKALRKVIKENTGMTDREVTAYLKKLKSDNQLREDVY